MAEEVQIAGGSGGRAKIRNPLAPALLPYVTFGIYTLVWYYKINKELAEMGRARGTDELGTSPVTSLMAVLFGWIIIVPPFVSFWNTWKRTTAAERMFGVSGGIETGLGFLLTILLAPVGHYLLQRDLNEVLRAQSGGGAGGGDLPAAPPLGAPAAPSQQQAPVPPAPGTQG